MRKNGRGELTGATVDSGPTEGGGMAVVIAQEVLEVEGEGTGGGDNPRPIRFLKLLSLLQSRSTLNAGEQEGKRHSTREIKRGPGRGVLA